MPPFVIAVVVVLAIFGVTVQSSYAAVSLKQAPVVIATSGETVYVVWRSSDPVTKNTEVSWRLIVA